MCTRDSMDRDGAVVPNTTMTLIPTQSSLRQLIPNPILPRNQALTEKSNPAASSRSWRETNSNSDGEDEHAEKTQQQQQMQEQVRERLGNWVHILFESDSTPNQVGIFFLTNQVKNNFFLLPSLRRTLSVNKVELDQMQSRQHVK